MAFSESLLLLSSSPSSLLRNCTFFQYLNCKYDRPASKKCVQILRHLVFYFIVTQVYSLIDNQENKESLTVRVQEAVVVVKVLLHSVLTLNLESRSKDTIHPPSLYPQPSSPISRHLLLRSYSVAFIPLLTINRTHTPNERCSWTSWPIHDHLQVHPLSFPRPTKSANSPELNLVPHTNDDGPSPAPVVATDSTETVMTDFIDERKSSGVETKNSFSVNSTLSMETFF